MVAEIGSLIYSIVRLALQFLMISILGCLVGHFIFHVSLDMLGLVVAIPSVVAFMVSRALILAIPRRDLVADLRHAHELPRLYRIRRKVGRLLAFVTLCGLFGSLVMLISAGIYQLLGLHEYVVGSVAFAMAILLIGALSVALSIVGLIWKSKSLHISTLLYFFLKVELVFWDVFRRITLVSRFIFGKYELAHAPHHTRYPNVRHRRNHRATPKPRAI